MARRKRASMREGPLADLFRSTVDPDDPPEAPSGGDRPAGESETGVMREQPAPPPERSVEPPPPPPASHAAPFDHAEGEPEPERPHAEPAPEQVRAYRTGDDPPGAKERLSRIFSDDVLDVEGPSYGREEPRYSSDFREATPHAPVIRVVGVGGAGVNAINRMVDAGIPGVEFLAVNTDLQSLQQSNADVTVHLGSGVAARPRRRLEPRARLPGGVRGAGQDQAPAQGHRPRLRHLRRRRRHRDRRGPGDRPARPRRRRAHGRDRDQAVPVRGHPPRRPGRGGRHRPRGRGRHADRRPQRAPADRAREDDDDGRGLPGRRRRPAPGRAGDLRADHAPGDDQPRLRRRAHDDARRRPRAARDRHGHRRQPRRAARPRARSPRRCSRPRSTARARSCSRSPAART